MNIPNNLGPYQQHDIDAQKNRRTFVRELVLVAATATATAVSMRGCMDEKSYSTKKQ